MNNQNQPILRVLQKNRSISTFINNFILKKCKLFISIANGIVEIKSHYAIERKPSNIIDLIGTNENGHSALLTEILRFKDQSGYVFLNSFIDCVINQDILFNHESTKIKAEYDRIDIFIHDGHKCLIIENKINNAADQPEQLKRYIDKCKFRGFEENNIYLLYLTGMDSKKDLSATLSTHLETFGAKTTITAYQSTIIDWLTSSVLPNVRYKDNDFYCFVSQYIDHLNGRFFKRPKDKIMNNEINEFISEQFGLKEGDLLENINKLEEELKTLNELQSRMNNILSVQKNKMFSDWAIKLRQDFPTLNICEGEDGTLTKTGILIDKEEGRFSILIEKTNSEIYFGMGRHFTDETKLNEDINLLVQPLMKGFRRTDWWYGWKKTSYEKGYNDLCQLINEYITRLQE